MTNCEKQLEAGVDRIVQVIANGQPSGGTTAVLTLSRLLADHGCQVVVMSQHGSYLLQEAKESGLATYGLDFSSIFSTLKAAVTLKRYFAELKPAVIHAHGGRAGLPTVIAVRCGSDSPPPKFVYTLHGIHYLRKPFGICQLARAAEKLCIGQADCTNFVSEGDLRIAQHEGLLGRARAYRTIKNAVLVDGSLTSSDKCYDIGFLGRLTYAKNPLLLVDILKAMRPLRPTLSVIGGGPLEVKLRSRVMEEGLAEQVFMQGECSRTEALKLTSCCRVLVLPSIWEGYPIALIEAMHMGIPVVASSVSGSNEIIVHGETGYLISPQDIHGYADALTRLLTDGQTMDAMKQNARCRLTVECSPHHMVAAHMKLYGFNSSTIASDPVPTLQ